MGSGEEKVERRGEGRTPVELVGPLARQDLRDLLHVLVAATRESLQEVRERQRLVLREELERGGVDDQPREEELRDAP